MATEPTTTPTPEVSKEDERRLQMSKLNLQNTSIATKLGTSSDHLDVEKAIDELLETRQSNKLLTKIIIGLVVYSFLFTAAIFGVSIAAAEIAKDTTINPSTGFVYAKGGEDSPIMKTTEALGSITTESIYGLSNEDLASIQSVTHEGGAVMFQVKGFSSTEEKTMLLVEGGVLNFDDTGLANVGGDHVQLIVEAFGNEGNRKLNLFCGKWNVATTEGSLLHHH